MATRWISAPANILKAGLGVIGSRAMGDLEIWGRGDTDYTIHAPPSSDTKMVAHRWGVMSTDETFAALFYEFMACFHQFEDDGSR